MTVITVSSIHFIAGHKRIYMGIVNARMQRRIILPCPDISRKKNTSVEKDSDAIMKNLREMKKESRLVVGWNCHDIP